MLWQMVPAVYPEELKAELEGENPPILVDVREEEEREISVLPNDIHIPMREIPLRFHELNPASDIVIYCRSGNRSGRVTQFLQQQGFTRVRNLETGINGWARTIDPSLPLY